MNKTPLYRPVLALIAIALVVALFYNMHLSAENPEYDGQTYSYGILALLAGLSGVYSAGNRKDKGGDE